jgi:hypothetical protein
MDESVKVKLGQKETRSVKIGRGVRQGCCLSPILFNLYGEYITKEGLEGFGDFKLGGQVIRSVKYTDGLVLVPKEATVLQGMTDRLIKVGSCGMEINVDKSKIITMSRQPSPVPVVIDQKQLENVEYLNYLHGMITSVARCTLEINSRIAMSQAAFNTKTLFASKFYLNLGKKLVKCYIWSIALYGAETWTLRVVDQKYLESLELWCWRRMEKKSWTDRVRK